MRRTIAAVLAAACLVSCDQAPIRKTTEKLEAFDVQEPDSAPATAAAGSQIAYSYTVSYVFDRPTVAKVQGDQLTLCRRLGNARCLVVRSTLHAPGVGGDAVAAGVATVDEAMLLVDARLATQFNRRLDALARAGGARLSERESTAEDVTRQVIDTNAKVRAKQALAERLLTIIRSAKGNVGELVQAERAYATTQEELDAARHEQASLAQRVAMSPVTINYLYNDPSESRGVILKSLRSAGDTLANSLAAMIAVIVAALPWLAVGGGLWLLVRRIARKQGWRRPRWGRKASGDMSPPTGE
ncbi:DUF4349 domain-containing protein [Sphingomonas sp. gentR]|jgi:hypothetical protein|uniref:DUF4349 domain-containing protein n=1 Tax=unclassified Sphingomonas TaxID=196159 RepID=UPI0009FB6135|nr:DUF4349 domain-containing protein [Sphingomonas sp. LK11]